MAETSTKDQVQQKWPSWAWALTVDPDVAAILTDPSITDVNQITAKIENTNWFKNTAPAVRNWTARNQMDPQGAAQDRQQKEADINDLYQSVGLTPNTQDQQALAQQALQFGWTDAQLKDAVVSHMKYSPDILNQAGDVQATASQFKAQAYNYGVSVDDQTAFNWSKQVSAGEKTAQDFVPVLQSWAKSRYPTLTPFIDAGVTVKDFFAPYQQEAAKLLEQPADTINLFDNPKWSQAVDYSDPKTGERRPMTLSEFQTHVRGMDDWKYTRQGQAAAAQIGTAIAQTFGKVGGGSNDASGNFANYGTAVS